MVGANVYKAKNDDAYHNKCVTEPVVLIAARAFKLFFLCLFFIFPRVALNFYILISLRAVTVRAALRPEA
jgi:hypothetical protein